MTFGSVTLGQCPFGSDGFVSVTLGLCLSPN